MSATRTLIDVARFVTPDRLTAALDAGLRDGLTSEMALHQRITESALESAVTASRNCSP